MPALGQNELKTILPQSYPFLMLDRIEDYKEGEWLIAAKNISADEWVFEQNNTSPGSPGILADFKNGPGDLGPRGTGARGLGDAGSPGRQGFKGPAEAGHIFFPDTLLIEAAAQAALVLYHVTKVRDTGRRRQYFIGKVNAEFIEPACVGDAVRIKVRAGKLLDTGGYTHVDITADDALKAKIELFFSVR